MNDRPKRLFDIVVAGTALVVLSPIFLIVALLVWVRLGRPIIFKHRRPGRHGRPFTLYKFRTMVDTKGKDGRLLPSVERTPPFGHRLRSLSLDELPELWNVLKGDMSLVGPRPLMMEYLPRYTTEQARRHEVRPGITGLAQVSGRNALTWEQKFALDVEYVDSHSLRLDLAILLRTVRAVLSRDGIRHGENLDMPTFLGSQASGADAAGAQRP